MRHTSQRNVPYHSNPPCSSCLSVNHFNSLSDDDAAAMYFAAWSVNDAGDQDAGGRCVIVCYLLAAAARVHPAHRFQAGHHRVRDHLTETLLRRRLFGSALAGDE